MSFPNVLFSDEKPFDQYLDDYYSIDYEDIIDGMPCRFKYRKTTANAYGLTPDEVSPSVGVRGELKIVTILSVHQAFS